MCAAMDAHLVLRTATHLRMIHLARWRTVDTVTKEIFDNDGEENAWWYCGQALAVNSRLIIDVSLYIREHRRLCFSFYSLLQPGKCMLSSDPLLVEDVEDAALIEHRLHEALRVRSAHSAAYGRDALVMLGRFCFRGKDETLFHFGGQDMHRTIAALPPGVLSVKARLHEGNLMTCASYRVKNGDQEKLCREAAYVPLTFNVSSAERNVSLAFHGVPLVLDGRWRSFKCSTSHCRSSQNYSSWPVLCAFTLLEVAPCMARSCSSQVVTRTNHTALPRSSANLINAERL
eukprot:TRINITY_DN5026_c0_g2_i1.p1 TRINITY_DN5026_c0_g2~~TRINITY_DN5026_c0_g2_i1.p1  ORF type:complete len:288 (-),score=26.67 TRINITY_DN5026_c0_g2_i1:368-1231(-)